MKQNYRKSHDTFDLPSGARPRNATYALCTALSEICDPEKFVLLLSKVAITILTLLRAAAVLSHQPLYSLHSDSADFIKLTSSYILCQLNSSCHRCQRSQV